MQWLAPFLFFLNLFQAAGRIGSTSGDNEKAQADEEENEADVAVFCIAQNEEIEVAGDFFHGGVPFRNE